MSVCEASLILMNIQLLFRSIMLVFSSSLTSTARPPLGLPLLATLVAFDQMHLNLSAQFGVD